MKELEGLIKRLEAEINETPSGELRNLLCDANILLQKNSLISPDTSNQKELLMDYELKIWINPTKQMIDTAEKIVDNYLRRNL